MWSVLRWLLGRGISENRTDEVSASPPLGADLQEQVAQPWPFAEKPYPSHRDALGDGSSRAARAYESMPFEQRQQLRKLDAEIAVVFLFFTRVEFQLSVCLKGIPRDHYDEFHPESYGRRNLVTVPFYSTDAKDFLALEERVKSWHKEAYLKVLEDQGLDEGTANLEQKSRAALRVRSGTVIAK